MSAADLCFSALTSTSNSEREGLLTAVVATLAFCGVFSVAMLLKARGPIGCIFTPTRICSVQSCVEIRWPSGTGSSNTSGALNRSLLDRYFWFMAAASVSGAITWYAGLRRQQAIIEAGVASSDCPSQQALNAISESWYSPYP
jgi:hypothetical protein